MGAGATGARRTLAPAADRTFWVKPAMKASFCPGSGLRTKSTAPADRASNTRRFREETRITGSGYCGSSFLRKSMPLIPGISTSEVITSGRSCPTLVRASWALMAMPATSIFGCFPSPWAIIVRAMMESSTTRTRTFLFAGHI